MNYYNKYLKYKKKYLLLTGGNFGNPATPGDFTQRFYDDNIIIQNNTLKINDYQDFEQLFSNRALNRMTKNPFVQSDQGIGGAE